MIFFARQKIIAILIICLAFLALVSFSEAFIPSEDSDGDDVNDELDNCDSIANPDQSDADADDIGDWCEEDAERFGFEMKAGTAPNSIFSIFDSLGETLGLFFAFSDEKKAEKALHYAQEKLAEMRQMMTAGNEKAAKKANSKYVFFMGVVKSKTDSLQEKESFSPLAAGAIKLINAHEDLVKQHGKEKWQSLEDRAANVQADFVSAVDVSPFAIAAPLALSQEERRERLCRIASGRKIKDETAKLFDTLCSAEFSADMPTKEKKTVLYATLFEAMGRNDISDRAKILLHQIIFTHLPEEEEERVGGAFLRRIFASMAESEVKLLAEGSVLDPSFSPQEAGSEARENQAIREMEQAVRKIRDNCPAPGYSSYAFWVACSIHDFLTGDMYSDQYAESGGPCKYNEMGSVEATHIQSDVWNYSGSQQEAGPDGEMRPKRSREVSCSVACASHNCGQYEEEETAKKGCENPAVYYLTGSKMSEEILLDMCTGRGVSDKIVPKEKSGLLGGLVKGIKKLFGGGEGVIAKEDLGNGYERIITRKNCELFNCTETEFEFAWGKEKVKSCCCTCAPNDETHRDRNVFDDWDWPGDNLIDRFLSRKQDILKKLEGLRDAFQTPKPAASDQQLTNQPTTTTIPSTGGTAPQHIPLQTPEPPTTQITIGQPASGVTVETPTPSLPSGDYNAAVYHKCSVVEGKNVDGKFEAKLRAEISVPEISAGGQVLYAKTNPIEFRTGICENSASEIPICQDPRYSSEPDYAQSKSFSYTEEYKYAASILKKEIDKTVQGDMAFMTGGKRPCTSSELGSVQSQETPVGYFEFLDPSNDWQPIQDIKVPGQTHFIAASDGTPDMRNYMPMIFILNTKASSEMVYYTFWQKTISDTGPYGDCRGATGCSVDGPTIPSSMQGNSFKLEARGKNGELLAEHEQ